MNTSRFAALTRRGSEQVVRRRWLLTLSGAALPALIGSAAGAKNGHKNKDKHQKRQKRCTRRCTRRCQAQVEPCRSVILTACTTGGGDAAGCQQRLLPCCEPLATCDAGSAIQCIATNAGG